MNKITQKEADRAATENEEFLNSREYHNGDYEAEYGKRADFSNCDLSGLEFKECFLDTALFQEAKLHDTVFKYCTLTETHFYKADLEGAVFIECNLDGSNFIQANCKKTTFIDCNLRDVNLSFADLRDAEFTNSDLDKSDLKNVKIRYTSNPELYRNVKAAGIRNNHFVKRWLEQQAYIAEFKMYHPVLCWFWKWGSDYSRSAWFLMAWYIAAILLFGTIYTFTDFFLYDKLSVLSGYKQAALMMIPFGYVRLLPWGWPGELLILSQAMLGYLLLILVGAMIVNRFRK